MCAFSDAGAWSSWPKAPISAKPRSCCRPPADERWRRRCPPGGRRRPGSMPSSATAPRNSRRCSAPFRTTAMLSDALAAALQKRNIHYGWVVAGTTFLVMLATAGAMGSAGVLILPLQKEFGWTTEQISGAFAVRLVFFGLLGPFAAAFMNHFGIRKVVT